ncbi:MAG: PQQ-binding-like beta-propeller repeat protein [Anaerolineae bacterium]
MDAPARRAGQRAAGSGGAGGGCCAGGRARLFALSAGSGDKVWEFETGNYILQTPFIADDRLFVGGSFYNPAQEVDEGGHSRLYALSAATGEPQWSYKAEDTVVHALAMDTGQTVWQYNIGGGSFNYALGAPVRVGDTLYLLSQQGDIIALNALNGAIRWQHPTGIRSRVGLSVSGGWLFIGDADGVVHAFTNSQTTQP